MPGFVIENVAPLRSSAVIFPVFATQFANRNRPAMRRSIATALQLARNRGLFDTGEDLAKRRAAFLTELRDLLRRIDRIEDLAVRRYIRDSQEPGRSATS